MKVLITSGATREPIDSVRFITNLSSGHTGASLADFFHAENFEVMLLRGIGSMVPRSALRSTSFVDFTDLNQILEQTLREEKIDIVIHLAAVSDFSVDWVKTGDETHYGPFAGKIDSNERVEIGLKRNFKIVDRLKAYGGQSQVPFVIAFKLTSEATKDEKRKAVDKLYSSGQVDLVVHNDTAEITEATHPFRLIKKNGEVLECLSLQGLAGELKEIIVQIPKNSQARSRQ